ncbi:MAG: NADH-quinone oxidoreductase subunit J [Cytophagales bacterium]
MDKFFYFLSFVTILTAILVVTSKNPVHSVLYLVLTFFAITGHYVLLNAQFLAIVNMVVYAGAIMVLFLFVIMFLNLNNEAEPKKNVFLLISGVIAAGCMFLVLTAAVKDVVINTPETVDSQIGIVANLGKKLFTDYVVPFEITSVLFLSAMIGAVVIGKKQSE